jgi:hypothetical protein
MVDGVNQQPGLFQRIGNFFGGDDPNAGQPTDPFAGLSRPQRTMLGFAALRDAAASLEGRDSNFFQSALGGFEEARERERLRTQGAPAPASQGQDFEAQRQAIFEQMRNRIAAGAGVADLQAQLDDINRREVEASSAQATEAEEEETREMRLERGRQVVMPRIDAALDFLISGYDENGQPIPNFALSTVGGLRALEATNPAAYRQYVNALQTLGSDVLIETLNRATFGSLSEEEMRVAMGFEGSLDPADPYGTLQTLLQMRRNFENLLGSGSPQGQGTNLPPVNWD